MRQRKLPLSNIGNELTTDVDYDGERYHAKALLETEEVIIRGALKLKVPFRGLEQIEAADGILRLRWPNHDLHIHLGKDAAKWAEKIRNPKSVVDKLGVKAGQRISVVGKIGDDFFMSLEKAGADASPRLRKDSDVIFFAADARQELERLGSLKGSLKPNGAIWVVRPKGVAAISEADVMAAGKAAGLVDVKVVRFSETHTAEKLVIPLTGR